MRIAMNSDPKLLYSTVFCLLEYHITGAILTLAQPLNAGIKAARNRLSEVCSSRGIPEDHQLVTLGRAADQIHEAASEKGVDTILIGSHARRGLGRLLGSTANAVLHGSPVNVMTIRVKE